MMISNSSTEDLQRYRILIPIANPACPAVLLPPAIKAAKERNGQMIPLHKKSQ